MTKRRSWGLGVVLACALAFAGLAVAGPGTRVSQLGRGAEFPALAVDAQGDQTLAWTQQRGNRYGQSFFVMTAARPAGERAWSRPVRISAVSEDPVAPVVAVNASGAAVAAWIEVVPGASGFASVVEARTRASASSRWRDVVHVASFPGSLNGLQVGIDGEGRITAVWNTYHGARSVLRSATGDVLDGRWQKARTLGRTGSSDLPSDLEVNGRGDVLVAWQKQVGVVAGFYGTPSLTFVQMVRSRFAGGPWGPAVAVHRLYLPDYGPGANGWAPTTPHAALDDRGGATVMWLSFPSGAPALFVAHRGPAARHWRSTQLAVINPSDPVIGTDGAGALTIAFSGQHGRLMVTGSSDGLKWSPPAEVPGPAISRGTWLSVGQRGNAILTWFASHTRIFVSVRRRVGRRWTPPTEIGHGVFPQAGLDRAGIASVVWLRTHLGTVLDATTYPTR